VKQTLDMQTFPLDDLLRRHGESGSLWMEFLRVPAMSAGIYCLLAGTDDPQGPHNEDEVYYIVAGHGKFTCEGRSVDAVPGTTIYVPARADHRFHDITQDLTILVIFAPAET
jgi:mannose-6-phosphate isomerase-like protein (cupin superfamily)